MKKIIFILALIATSLSSYSQNVIHGEYFIDAETGFGNGTPFTISLPDSDITQSYNIPYGSFPSPGYHYIFIRTLDVNGNWSITKRKLVEADENNGLLSVINIEYFFDVDNGFGSNNSTQLVASTDSTWTFNIPYNQIPATWTTNDTLFLRVQDSIRSNWSITTMIDSLNFTMVGIDELIQLTGVAVFPNPFSDELNLILEKSDMVDVKLYNISGELIFGKSIYQSAKFDTKFLSTGVYLLYVSSKNGKTYSTKILKE